MTALTSRIRCTNRPPGSTATAHGSTVILTLWPKPRIDSITCSIVSLTEPATRADTAKVIVGNDRDSLGRKIY